MADKPVRGGSPRFYEVLEELAQLHSDKNADYGNGRPFGNILSTAEDFNLPPHVGVFIRMGDKWARIKSYVQKGTLTVKDESVIDSLRDLAVYAIIASILIEESAKETSMLQRDPVVASEASNWDGSIRGLR